MSGTKGGTKLIHGMFAALKKLLETFWEVQDLTENCSVREDWAEKHEE